jgi:putative nucleotidyltransferase with HDIG domain
LNVGTRNKDAPSPLGGWEAEGNQARPSFLESSEQSPVRDADPSKPDGDDDSHEIEASVAALTMEVLDAAVAQDPQAKKVMGAFHENLKAERPRIPNLADGKPPPMPQTSDKSPGPRDELIAAARGEPKFALNLLRHLSEGPGIISPRTLDLANIGRRIPMSTLRSLTSGGGTSKAKSPWDPLLTKVWRHTLLTARTAEILAQDRLRREPGAIYTIALLHNIGEVAIIDLFRGLGHKAPKDGVARGPLLREMNRFHEIIGAVILKRWKLPSIVSAVAKGHHDPGSYDPNSPHGRYAALIGCASAAVTRDGLAYKELDDGTQQGNVSTCADILGVNDAALSAAVTTAKNEWSPE